MQMRLTLSLPDPYTFSAAWKVKTKGGRQMDGSPSASFIKSQPDRS